MITIVGPTACGKTSLAVALADKLHSEIISGDSRQLYKGMDIGTGKDLADYVIKDHKIPYHLIDIADAGTKYDIYQFQRDFLKAYNEITSRGIEPIFCGGSGLYVESILRSYRLFNVPQNQKLRDSLQDKSLEELTHILSSVKTLHNKTDIDSAQRAIRAIEIETYYQNIPTEQRSFPTLPNTTFGINIPRELRRDRITNRLHTRLAEGMLNETQSLLDSGIPPKSLIYYGLEYKYLTLHLIGQISYDKMVHDLEIAIHQFAKRQMTWFRGMERRGIKINWIDGTLPMKEKVDAILNLVNNNNANQ